MAIKSTWAARNGDRILRQSLQEARTIDAARAPARAVVTRPQRPGREAFEQAWEALTEGHSLEVFGLPAAVVAKKNRKSVVTTLGSKYTKAELAAMVGVE